MDIAPLITKYLPATPGASSRGKVALTQAELRQQVARQGGGSGTLIFQAYSYLVVTDDWIMQALKKFHDFQRAVYGMPPQDLLIDGVYMCLENALSFHVFLAYCHRMHWTRELGKSKLAIGWGYTGGYVHGTNLPANHGVNLVGIYHKGETQLWGYESQAEGKVKQYGHCVCWPFWFLHF